MGFTGVIGFGHHLPRGIAMCEDYPCCGHEMGDCRGQRYGSDESIKAAAYRRMELEDQGIFMDDDY